MIAAARLRKQPTFWLVRCDTFPTRKMGKFAQGLPLVEAGINAVHELVNFEANRRATILILSLQAYRFEHGKLPVSLSELIPDFGRLPRDPYSGQFYRYFPQGLRKALEDLPQSKSPRDDHYAQSGIWCTGPQLQFSMSSEQEESPGAEVEVITSVHEPCYKLRIRPHELKQSFAQVWTHGMWFPIPQSRK